MQHKQNEKQKIKEQYPELEDLMFRNKSAMEKAKKKKYFKEKYKKK